MAFPSDSVVKSPPVIARDARVVGPIPQGDPRGANGTRLQHPCLRNSKGDTEKPGGLQSTEPQRVGQD